MNSRNSLVRNAFVTLCSWGTPTLIQFGKENNGGPVPMLANPIGKTAKYLLIYNILLCFVTVVSLIAFIVQLQNKSKLMEDPSASFDLALKQNLQLILVFA